MKQSILALLCSVLFSTNVFAQETKAWTVQVDPLTTYLGFVHLQFERKVVPQLSIYAGPHVRLFSAPGLEREDFLGAGLETGVRWFPWGAAPTGPWALVRGVGARVWNDNDATFGGYGSALVGYTYIAWEILVLSGGAGVQYLHYHVDGLGPKGFAPALHTAIGLAF